MAARRGAYKFLVGQPEGNRPLERPRHRWEILLKLDLQDVGWKAWTELI